MSMVRADGGWKCIVDVAGPPVLPERLMRHCGAGSLKEQGFGWVVRAIAGGREGSGVWQVLRLPTVGVAPQCLTVDLPISGMRRPTSFLVGSPVPGATRAACLGGHGHASAS